MIKRDIGHDIEYMANHIQHVFPLSTSNIRVQEESRFQTFAKKEMCIVICIVDDNPKHNNL